MEKEYRFYIYDWLFEEHLLTIDTQMSRWRIDSFNVYGQCYTFGRDEWKKITKALIDRSLTDSGHVINRFIEEHFTDSEPRLTEKVLFKTNDYNECIKFIAEFGAKNEETIENVDYTNYYKNYLDIPENRIGNILENGEVIKEYFQEGYIYKNIANFCRKEGICYISEDGTDKVNRKSIAGKDYETYKTIFNKVKKNFEQYNVNQKKYSIEDFTRTIFKDLTGQDADTLIIESIEALDDEYFLDSESELEN